jgi:oligopeptide transport system substrate-binding protein
MPGAMRILAAALLAAVSGVALAAGTQVFRSGHTGEPDTLDPQLAVTGTALVIASDLFEGLVTRNARGEIVPGAAERWTVDPSGLTYVFELRRGLGWSDGTPLDARDFEYSFRRLADPATAASSLAGQLRVVTGGEAALAGRSPPSALGVRAPAPTRLEIRLTRPAPWFLEVLASPAFAPVPRHAIERWGRDWTRPGRLVSNGAFVLAERRPGGPVSVTRNPRFRDARSVRLDEVQYFPLESLEAGFRRFQAGELDALVNFPPERLDWIRANMPGTLRLSPSLGVYVYVPNLTRPPLNDARVRRALSLALDRERLTQALLRTGDRPAWGVVPAGAGNPAGALPDPDARLSRAQRVAEARRLLREAGYDAAHPLKLRITFHTSEEHRRIALAVASLWKEAGVDATPDNAERRVVESRARDGDFELVRMLWFSPYDDPEGFLDFFRKGHPSNFTGYSSAAFEALMSEADAERDSRKRLALLRDAERRVIADSAVLPIYFLVSRRLVSRRVRGWESGNPTAFHPARYLSIAPVDNR